MVAKLIKHEFNSNMKILLAADLFLLILAGLSRFFTSLDSESVFVEIFSGFSIIAVVFGCFAVFILATVMGIVRFYKNMFSSEGYLTLTLPLTAAQHIFAKLLCAVTYHLITTICVVAAIILLIPSAAWQEVITAFEYAFSGEIPTQVSITTGEGIVLAIQFCILIIVSLAQSYLLYYACMSLGQLARKNRILASVGFYMLYNFISQLLGSIFSIVMGIASTTLETDTVITQPADVNVFQAFSVLFIIAIVFSLILSVIFFLISRFIITKKLNLE